MGDRMKVMGLIVLAVLTSVCFAQDFTNLPEYKQAPAVVEIERKTAALKSIIELPLPAEEPAAKLDVSEFLMKQADYVGQVVELTFDQVLTLKQYGSSGYIATVTYKRLDRRASDIASVEIAVPHEGLKIFREVYELNGTTRQTKVMVQVIVGSKVRAVGERYRGDAPVGERYRW